jgi:hypothetical protein
MFYSLSVESRHLTIIPGEIINILFKQIYYNIFVF